MKAFSDLRLFVRAARSTSLSEAARSLDITPASASATIRRLEDEIGVPLFIRSTRSLRLTPQGEHLLAKCEPALDTIIAAAEGLEVRENALSGCINLAMPSDFGRSLALNWISVFQRSNSRVMFKVQISDHLASRYRDQIDISLRYSASPDTSVTQLVLAPTNHRVLCASPRYIERFGAPALPQELVDHNCLCFMLNDRLHNKWSFARGEEKLTVEVLGRFQSDDGDAVRRLAVAGVGITYKSELDVAADLKSGALVRLCSDWQTEAAPLFMVCADRRMNRPLVRAFSSFLAEQCSHLLND